MVTQSNWIPSTGKNPVTSSTKTAMDIDQWKKREPNECRTMRSGMAAALAGGVSETATSLCLLRQTRCPMTKSAPPASASQKSCQETWVRMVCPQGFCAHWKKLIEVRPPTLAGSNRAAHQVPHQRNLVRIVLQGTGAEDRELSRGF